MHRGATCRDRTGDLLVTSELLYQLSQGGNEEDYIKENVSLHMHNRLFLTFML